MTSINVLKLNFYSGILLCDESRYWNPEWMVFYTPEKIQSMLREDIMKEQDLLLFFGQTGTSSIGDEFIDSIAKEISKAYDKRKKELGEIPAAFMSIEELAHFAFDVIVDIKQTHIDDFLKGKYGFTTKEFSRKEYEVNGTLIPIEDEEIIKSAFKYIMFDDAPKEVTGIFGNSQLLAGYDPVGGFRIFYMTERTPICEEVQEAFLALGSGRDTCDLEYATFASSRPVRDRRGNIDPGTGLVAMLRGLALACKQAAGVGGYPKIIYVDAKQKSPEKRVKVVFDKRSKLAMEMILAAEADLIAKKDVHELVEQLIFHDVPFGEINEKMLSSCKNAKNLFSFLRGYPV
jgi:hypothetical protein